MHDKSLASTKQNLVKSKFPFINMFDHQLINVVHAMCDLKVGGFEQLQINSPMYFGQRVGYTKRIIRVSSLKKYKQVLVELKESAKGLYGYQWMLGTTKKLTLSNYELGKRLMLTTAQGVCTWALYMYQLLEMDLV